MKSIVVLGSVNADLVVKAARAPEAGETLPAKDFTVFPGGKGANQAVAASRLAPGCVSLVGMVGTDPFAGLLRQSLESAGVDLRSLATVDGSSGVALIVVDSRGQNRILVVPGANTALSREIVEQHREQLASAGVVLLQLETPLESVRHAASIAFANGVLVILDPAPAQPLDPALLQCVTWLTPNYTEACVLTGRPHDAGSENIDALLDGLLRLGPQHVLLKLGEQGLALATADGQRHRIPAFSVTAVDTTAAGDALNASFAVGLAEGLSPFEAARWGTAVAAIAVTRWGAQPAMPSREEVELFLQQNSAAMPEKGTSHA